MARRSARPSLRDVGVRRISTPAGPRYQDRTRGTFVKTSTVKARLTRAERAAPTRPGREVRPAPTRPVPPAPPPPLPATPYQKISPRQQREMAKTPVMVKRDRLERYRDKRGRFVKARSVERMSDTTRKKRGIKRVLFFRTKAGQLGPRVKPLVDALREFEDADLDWREVPDHYFKRAQALALV